MTIERMIELLEIEHECMLRGAHDDCDRNCADCELVQDDGDLHEMYTDVIAILKEQEPVKPKYKERVGGFFTGLCPTCGTALNNVLNAKACGKCGQELKWND